MIKLYCDTGNSSITPQLFDLSGGQISEHQPEYNRLILKVVPKMCYDSSRSLYGLPTSVNMNSDSVALCHSNRLATDASIFDDHTVYNSTCSINSSNSCDRQKILFFGFEESWERDLWSAWLVKVSAVF